MTTTSIPATTTLGAVHLTVTDLDRSLAYYTQRLGLALHARSADAARLGAGGEDLLVLTGDPAARRARGATGLFHVAILVPSRADLAAVLQHLVVTRTPIDGASDHLVSEALYLSDPDGNGIEIYRDRLRGEWPRDAAGALRMATDPLDAQGLLAERAGSSEPWAGMAAGTRIGHVHLQVSRIDASERFYVDVLGFDLVQRYGPGASFVSAGGYPHHIGMNTWAGVGAPPPPPGSVGLRHVEVRLPDAESLAGIAARAREAGHAVVVTTAGTDITDPSGNHLLFTLQHSGAWS
jgi:catechol 2,3-dioxygenase